MAVSKRSDLPAIPAQAGALRPILEAMREVMVTGEGHRGDPLDRKITVRDLVGSGLAEIRRGASPGIGGLVPTNPAPDRTIPPAPGGFQGVSVFGFITLIWDSPSKHYRNHGLTNIYRSTEDNIGNAVLVGRTAGFSYNDPMRGDVANASGFYYWIRWVSAAGIEGPPNSPDGTYIEPTPDMDWLLEEIGGKIDESWLSQELNNRIDLIDGSGPGSLNELRSSVDALSASVSEIMGSEEHDPARDYLAGAWVKSGGALYHAKQAVPVGIPITDTAYWERVGDYSSLGDLVAAINVRLNTTETVVDELTGEVSANSTSLNALQARAHNQSADADLEAAIQAWESNARYAEQVKTQARDNFAMVERTSLLEASVGATNAQLSELDRTVATQNTALAEQIVLLDSTLGETNSQLLGLSRTVAEQENALSTRIDSVSVKADRAGDAAGAAQGSADQASQAATDAHQAATAAQQTANTATAAVQNEQTARINGDITQAQATQQLQTVVGQNTATLLAQGEVVDGLAASYVLKTDVNGRVAGFGHYNDGEVADFAIVSDRFWIAAPGSTDKVKPFMLVGNVNYLDTAMIRDASIQEGKLGAISFGKLVDAEGNPITTVTGKLMAEHIAVDQIEIGFAQVSGDIYSDDYIPGQRGWKLSRNGTIEFNGEFPGGGRLSIDNRLIQIFYPSGALCVRMGFWGRLAAA